MSGAGGRSPDALARARAALAGGDAGTAYALAGAGIATEDASTTERHLLCANAAMQLGRWEDALSHLHWLHARLPAAAPIARGLAQCWLKQGNALKQRGEPIAAEDAYRNALRHQPDFADAHYNLALMLLASARPAEALEHLNRSGSDVDVQLARGRALAALGQWETATAALVQVQARVPHAPDAELGELAASLAQPFVMSSNLGAALRDPTGWREALTLAETLRAHGDGAGAQDVLTTALSVAKEGEARLRLSLALWLGLPAVADSAADLARRRADYARGLQQLVDAYPPAILAAQSIPTAALAWHNFYLAYHGEDDRALQVRFGQWLSDGLARLLPQHTHVTARPPRVRPRVALVSSFLRECTVGNYFLAWAEHLAAAGFEIVPVLLQARADATSARYAACGPLQSLRGTLEQDAAAIAALDADLVLYPELGMDARAFALAALRLAPRQACAWGHPITTGLPTIDAYFSCAEMEPADAAQHYSERLCLLPGLGTVYPAAPLPRERPREAFGLPRDRTLYLLPQSPFKLHPDMDAVVVDLVQRDPSALVVGFLGPASGASVRVHRRLERALGERGLDARRHLRWLPACPRNDYLAVNALCDVMLDSLRWSGGNASIDALCAGLPIVTCPGALMRGRQTAAMLQRLDCPEWIAATPADLAARTVAVAQQRRADRHRDPRLAAALPRLLGDRAPLEQLTAHLRAWLATAPPHP